MDVLLAEVAQVQVYGRAVRGVDRAALLQLVPERLRDPVARAELHELVFGVTQRGLRAEAVVLQVAVAILVHQDAALPASALGEQHARAGQRRRVILHELHVTQGDASPIGHRHAVRRADGTVGVGAVDPARPTGGEHDCSGLKQHRVAIAQGVGEHAAGSALMHHELEPEVLVIAGDLRVLQRRLEHRVQHVEAGLVGGKPGSWLAHTAEAAHVDVAVGAPAPRDAPLF